MTRLFGNLCDGREYVTLEYIKRYASSARTRRWFNRMVHIWSAEHGAYWRENSSGYCVEKAGAGLYTFTEAYKTTNHCGPEKCIQYFEVPA